MSDPTTASHELQERFGELRSTAHSLTGEARWTRLVEHLDGWPKTHFQDVVLPYLHDLLRDDTSPRVAPPHWYTIGRSHLTVHQAFPLARMLFISQDVTRHLSAKACAVLFGSPHLAHLTRLDLGSNAITVAGAQALANAPLLKHLTTLGLDDNEPGHRGANALANSLYLTEHIRAPWQDR